MLHILFNILRIPSNLSEMRKNPQSKYQYFLKFTLSKSLITKPRSKISKMKKIIPRRIVSKHQLCKGACIECEMWKRMCVQTAWRRTRSCKYHDYTYHSIRQTRSTFKAIHADRVDSPSCLNLLIVDQCYRSFSRVLNNCTILRC